MPPPALFELLLFLLALFLTLRPSIFFVAAFLDRLAAILAGPALAVAVFRGRLVAIVPFAAVFRVALALGFRIPPLRLPLAVALIALPRLDFFRPDFFP